MVFEEVRQILMDQLDVSEDDVTTESEIIDDLGADSLDLVDIVMTLEDEFEVEIPETSIEDIKTVGDLVDYIENNR